MAHIITGIDMGSWSAKFVLIEAGFRQQKVVSTLEERVPDGDAPLVDRQADALAAGMARLGREATAFMAMPGDALAIRLLDLPFADVRKIEQVIGYELEGQIVHALSDVVYDQAQVRSVGPGSTVLAAAARNEDMAAFLEAARLQGVEPRSVFAAPVVYQALGFAAAGEEGTLPACRLLLDIGHLRTNACVLQNGATVFARTITRGGAVLTAAIAQAFDQDTAHAEAAKHEHGFLASARVPPAGPVQRSMDSVLREAMTPWLREVRQTLAAYRARSKTPVESILITGGGAKLGGLREFLEEELGMPALPFVPDLGQSTDLGVDVDAVGVVALEPARFTLAAAIAWAGLRGRKELDLRRGPFVYRANLSVLRQKARHLLTLAAALLVAVTIDGSMALGRLNQQKDTLTAQLRTATQDLFGAPRMDAKQVALELKKSFRDEMAPIPKATALDLLDQISQKTPSAERIKLDITELDIKAKKTFIKGTVDSVAAVDELANKLKDIDCYEEITKGPIVEVSGGAKQFTLTIASKCP